MPKFANPMVQRKCIEQAEQMSPLRTVIFPISGGWNDHSFLFKICTAANQIVCRNSVNRIILEEERVTQMHQDEGQQEEDNTWMQNKVQEQIDFALASDLFRRPRLSRSPGATSILIHDRT